MKPKPITDDELNGFLERMRFLEMMWGARTRFSIDSSTGRGDVQILPPNSETVLFLDNIDARSIRIVERHKGIFPDAPPSVGTP